MIACLLLYTVGPVPACAIQASPHVIHETQPDGTGIRLHIRGSEYFHWYEDLAGFTVLRDKGRYVYARLGKDQRLVPTSWEVGKVDPAARGLKGSCRPGILSGNSVPGVMHCRQRAGPPCRRRQR